MLILLMQLLLEQFQQFIIAPLQFKVVEQLQSHLQLTKVQMLLSILKAAAVQPSQRLQMEKLQLLLEQFQQSQIIIEQMLK